MKRSLEVLLSFSFTLACASPPEQPVTDASEVSQAELSTAPVLLEPGTGLTLLGLTSDGFAVYQSGNTIRTRALGSHGAAVTVATIPAGAQPAVIVRGRVAFIWPNAATGVGSLVVWSARDGAHEASANSVIVAAATESSPEGDQVVFVELAASGSSVDLVVAPTGLATRRTLVSDATLGACSPLAGFLGDDDEATPVTLSCSTTAPTTANLTVFGEHGPVTLPTALRVPTVMSIKRDGSRLYTVTAAREGIVVDAEGRSRVVDPGPAGTGYWTKDAVTYAARTPTGVEVRRVEARGGRPVVVAPRIASFAAFIYGVRDSAVSPDGSKIPFVTGFDPSTGIADQHVLETRGGVTTETVAEASQQTLLCGLGFMGPANPFTADSSHFLFAQRVDPTTFLSPMAAFDGVRVRTFSDSLGYSCTPAASRWVVFNDHTNLGTLTADLRLVNLADSNLTARLIWSGANLNYVVSPNGRRLAFTTEATASQPAGLYALTLPR